MGLRATPPLSINSSLLICLPAGMNERSTMTWLLVEGVPVRDPAREFAAPSGSLALTLLPGHLMFSGPSPDSLTRARKPLLKPRGGRQVLMFSRYPHHDDPLPAEMEFLPFKPSVEPVHALWRQRALRRQRVLRRRPTRCTGEA